MIARNETSMNRVDFWSKLAAPLPPSIVQWRQQGKPKERGGKFFAPFVAYIDAQFVRARLDEIVPGEWDLTLELLPLVAADQHGEAAEEGVAFKARLQILGVVREDVGTGRDYKTAATDAFKRAAVRFGVGHELYTDYEIVWVQVDSDSKFAKPVEDPAAVYARKSKPRVEGEQRPNPTPSTTSSTASAPLSSPREAPSESVSTNSANGSLASDEPSCPKCGGRLWDNRLTKKNPKQPDYRCRRRDCDGVIWPPKANAPTTTRDGRGGADGPYTSGPLDDEDEVPFR